MKVFQETTIESLVLNREFWPSVDGPERNRVYELSWDELETLTSVFEDIYEEIDMVQLNDIFRFDFEWILETLGITEEELEGRPF